jgi:uncharacterized protein YdhG (YjbR/CyaY superfamily)
LQRDLDLSKRGENAMTIREYIDSQEESIRPRLNAVYDAIRAAIPEAEERLSWGMPTFWKGRNIIHFAPAKAHIGLYPGAEAVAFFAPRLMEYKTSKGAIQFPNNRELPLELIAEIARWSWETNKK